jgi:hypothetical protein
MNKRHHSQPEYRNSAENIEYQIKAKKSNNLLEHYSWFSEDLLFTHPYMLVIYEVRDLDGA